MSALLVVIVVINSLILVAVIVGAVLLAIRLHKSADAAEATLVLLSEQLPGTLQAANEALRSLDSAAKHAEAEVDRIGSVVKSVDRIVSGAAVAEAAVKAAHEGKSTVSGVVAGALEFLKQLKGAKGQTKEGSDNG